MEREREMYIEISIGATCTCTRRETDRGMSTINCHSERSDRCQRGTLGTSVLSLDCCISAQVFPCTYITAKYEVCTSHQAKGVFF